MSTFSWCWASTSPAIVLNGFGVGANSSGPAVAPAAPSPLNGDDTFSVLAARLAQARSDAIEAGLPTYDAELVITEEEWEELNDALKLRAAEGSLGWDLSAPIELWGVKVRVDWKPETLAAQRKLDDHVAKKDLLEMLRRLKETG